MPSSTPPLGIRSIELTDFRGIDRLRLEFVGAGDGPSDIVVIGGPNGCGKTSVLEACLLAVGYRGELQGAKGSGAARSGRHPWTVKAEIQTPYGRYQSVARESGEPDWAKLTDVNGLQASRPVNIPCMYFSSWRAPKLVGALSITAGKPGKRPADTDTNRVWRAKQYLIDSRAHKLMSQTPIPELWDLYDEDRRRLNEVWAMFHPHAREEFVVEPVNTDPSAGFDVFLSSTDGRRVSVDALSSGQLELFGLFGGLMLAKFRDGVLVIDEPELHLDPQWHALMVRAIRRFLPAAQLLIATHSPRVYESVMSFQRHFVVPEGDPRARAWMPLPGGAATA